VTFGAVGLNGKASGFEMVGESFLVVEIDDLVSVEPDFDVGTDGFYAEGVPLFWFSELVLGVSFVEPVVEVKSDRFIGGSTADVHLETITFLPILVPKVDPAVVLSMFVDLEIEAEVKVLKTGFGNEEARAFWVSILTSGENAILIRPLGASFGRPVVE
jgi:hypothetical protein